MKTQSQTEHHYGKPLLFFSAVTIAVSVDALQMEKVELNEDEGKTSRLSTA